MKHKRDFKALEKRRLNGAKLLAQGVSQAEVARRLEVKRQSVSEWAGLLKAKGFEGLKRRQRGRPRQLSDAQCAELSAMLVKGAIAQGFPNELWTLQRVAKLIKERFGVEYSTGHMWYLLRRLGFSAQRPERRALQRDEQAIERWKRKRWPALKKTPHADDKP
jgi:transposase